MEAGREGSEPVSMEELFRQFPAFSKGFTEFHKQLLDLCVGAAPGPKRDGFKPLQGPSVTKEDLGAMYRMVQLEFLSSLEKEIAAPRDEIKSAAPLEPNVFDVCLMEQTLFHGTGQTIAVCMPLRGPRGGGSQVGESQGNKRDRFCWYDGRVDTVVPLNEWKAIRKVASLSGPARVLENLSRRPEDFPLMLAAMERKGIVQVMNDYEVDRYNNQTNGEFQVVTAEMNTSQQRAVATVASTTTFTNGFVAIQGPPGTGKTTCLVGMIALLESGVIVTAPSNAAVANVALKLYDTQRYDVSELCVFGENCDESVQFLNPVHRWRKYKGFIGLYGELDDDEKKEQARIAFCEWLHLDEADHTIRELGELCPKAHREDRQGTAVLAECIREANVILVTVNSSASQFLRDQVPARKFRTLILDEAGQCNEAEFYITTTFPDVERIVVVGDPKQLPATVIDRDCKLAGFGMSWLGRVFDTDRETVHILDTQYRMDPAILAFPNKRFYQDRIQSGVDPSRNSGVASPFQFVDTNGQGREQNQDKSWKNVYEATVIKVLLHRDPDIKQVLKQNPKARVVVITPYRAQAELLRAMLQIRNVKVEVSTVDSVQGQDADIVLLSTVRTKKVGFTDDSQRLNVALTRAKLVLRIIGDKKFFLSLQSPRSTLRALAEWADRRNQVKCSEIKSIPWCPPDWKQFHLWKVNLTARFHSCLSGMGERDRNISLNTLSAVAKPRVLDLLYPPPPRDSPSWIMSCLKGYTRNGINVVWIARKRYGLLTIEGHYAGCRNDCLSFMQRYPDVPHEACRVEKDLSGLVESKQETVRPERREFVVSWPLTNTLQNSIGSGVKLPRGSMQLDDHQHEVAVSSPPLLIESRSGTGKTLVLLQHAASFARADEDRPACFVTVSPRLRDELQKQYEELQSIENNSLPPTLFFSLKDLLKQLLHLASINDFNDAERKCSFLEYVASRTSHEKMTLDENLVESEIGGVIMGSLAAADQKCSLSRAQYLEDKRSNIPTKTTDGVRDRDLVYDEFERYNRWKLSEKKFDMNDIVSKLLTVDFGQLFSSAYLDEVQDLTHAMIFLICNAAGKETLHWVCAGDACQMISPGCSFTFDGLKQTLLKVQPGIESKLSKVSHLLVNYRTTEDILLAGNAILRVAKEAFPDAIEFALPERSTRDLGLKVVLCDWGAAMGTKVAFGENQALIYSSVGSQDTASEVSEWLDKHPFILSSLESKGLEFEDVVVAFDLERKAWDISRKRVVSLRMLRELYVAVTRGRRRVVILTKKNTGMQSFFGSLGCNLEIAQDASVVFQEFDKKTTPEAWFQKGKELLAADQFKLAANCFAKADQEGWLFLARGRDMEETGMRVKAVAAFREAARHFHRANDFCKVLDMFCRVAKYPSIAWDHSDDTYVNSALREMPSHLHRIDIVNLALLREKWRDLSVMDIKSPTTFELFRSHRGKSELKQIVANCSDEDRSDISILLPTIVGDFHMDRNDYVNALRLYAHAEEVASAEKAALGWIKKLAASTSAAIESEGPDVVQLLQGSEVRCEDKIVLLLLELFASPARMSKAKLSECCREFDRRLVLCAFDYVNDDRLYLHEFNPKMFKNEISEALVSKYNENILNGILWFVSKSDEDGAVRFRKDHVQQLPVEQILQLLIDLKLNPSSLFRNLSTTKSISSTVKLVLEATSLNDSQRSQLESAYLSFHPSATVAECIFWATLMMICITSKLENLGCVVLSRVFRLGCCGDSEILKLAAFYSTCMRHWTEMMRGSEPAGDLAPESGSKSKKRSKKQKRKNKGTAHMTPGSLSTDKSRQKKLQASLTDVANRRRGSARSLPLLLCKDKLVLFAKDRTQPSLLLSTLGPDVARYTQLHNWDQQYSEKLHEKVSQFHFELRKTVADRFRWRQKRRENLKVVAQALVESTSRYDGVSERDETIALLLSFGPAMAHFTRMQSDAPHDTQKWSQFVAFRSQLSIVTNALEMEPNLLPTMIQKRFGHGGRVFEAASTTTGQTNGPSRTQQQEPVRNWFELSLAQNLKGNVKKPARKISEATTAIDLHTNNGKDSAQQLDKPTSNSKKNKKAKNRKKNKRKK